MHRKYSGDEKWPTGRCILAVSEPHCHRLVNAGARGDQLSGLTRQLRRSGGEQPQPQPHFKTFHAH